MRNGWNPADDVPGNTQPLPPVRGQWPPPPARRPHSQWPHSQWPHSQWPHSQRPPGQEYVPGPRYSPEAYSPGTRYIRGHRPRRRGRRVLKRLALTVTALIVVVSLAFAGLLLVTPSASQAPALAGAQARARGIAYPGPDVPANFSRPLIATEDKRFYSEPGVDPFAVVRWAWGNVSGDRSDIGGAAIPQQLAKLLYTPGRSGAASELEQVALAFKLDYAYSRPRILRLYAEVAYYGHGYYGLEAASCGYFGHPASALTPVQGAMLAGAVNAPAIDDPVTHPGTARARLDHVIGRMVAVGDLTPAQGQRLMKTPLGLVTAGAKASGAKAKGC